MKYDWEMIIGVCDAQPKIYDWEMIIVGYDAQPKPEGLSSYSPGHRPGYSHVSSFAPCKGTICTQKIMPLQGASCVSAITQGDALGYMMKAFQALAAHHYAA